MLIILKINCAEEMISYDVNSNSYIELLKEILKLRYSFGYDTDEVLLIQKEILV